MGGSGGEFGWGVRVGCSGGVSEWGVRVGRSSGVFGWGVRVGCSGGAFGGWGVHFHMSRQAQSEAPQDYGCLSHAVGASATRQRGEVVRNDNNQTSRLGYR